MYIDTVYLATPTALQNQDNLCKYYLLYNFQKHYFHREECPDQQFTTQFSLLSVVPYTIMPQII